MQIFDLCTIAVFTTHMQLVFECTLQYFWASLVAQSIKNPPAMQETWVQSQGWEDPLEMGKVTHSITTFEN